ncbi:MAG: spore germination protein [Eubacteriales bacterium]
MKLFKFLYNRILTPKKNAPNQQKRNDKKISANLQINQKIIREVLGDSDDVILRRFIIGGGQAEAILLHIDGMSDKIFIADNVMKSLMSLDTLAGVRNFEPKTLFEAVKDSILTVGEIHETDEQNNLFEMVVSGDTALMVAGIEKALIIGTKGFKSRGVEEPETEAVVRGPREGFSEPLRINTSLLRRKIRSLNLRFNTIVVGRETKTKVSLAYLKGVCDEKIVQEVKNRIHRIDTDAIFGAGFIEEFIEDAPYSPFATIAYTERPDVAAAKILEGRVAIIVDGTPIVLTVPHLFIEGFQSAEDYLIRSHYITLIRWVRYIAFFITIYLPAMYLALTTFQQEMIPTQLLVTMASAREGVPFPAFVEAIGMGLIFEILREAGIRMPRPVGQAVSIVGALVIGQSAVSAGLVGAPMVIVTALTAITSFVVPSKEDVTTILRVSFAVVAGIAGIFGLTLFTIIIMTHLVSLRSFGVPYLSPLAPMTLKDLQDVLVKVPAWARKTRPRVIGYNNLRRQGKSLEPHPPNNKQ